MVSFAKGTSLAQVHSRRHVEVFRRAASLLKRRADEIGSKELVLLADRALQGPSDPLHYLIRMIEELLPKLQSELGSLVQKKAMCDKELSVNNYTRHTKSTLIQELHSTVEQNHAELHSIFYQLKALDESLDKGRKELVEASKMREEEKVRNAGAIKEAHSAQLAVEQAKEVLEAVYARAALLQTDVSALDDVQGSYDGHGARGGVLAMLEVLITDFTKLEADTNDAEAAALQKYQDFKTECLKDVKVKEIEKAHKEGRREKLNAEILTAEKDLKLTEKELQAAQDYFAELKPICINGEPSYEERQAKRDKEIGALREALSLLA
ncbi:unnamed protein product [Effrenium voratum]|uniref:Uncharacterized protein n=1 Tax=Effrenium voratum TaxID=2562239 RepID=A0AA36IIM7_9DINO|nr:unnamed protein product [Effrenium voratum]CAJ1453632.1 unnamed protein product [Effrenium voratum]